MGTSKSLVVGDTLTIDVPKGATKITVRLHSVGGTWIIVEIGHDRMFDRA